ncbi:MAG: hypothetical protein LIP10_04655 [Clostridiales bacterium]|nr:hypothetical protein [Clostridiales bacterium]
MNNSVPIVYQTHRHRPEMPCLQGLRALVIAVCNTSIAGSIPAGTSEGITEMWFLFYVLVDRRARKLENFKAIAGYSWCGQVGIRLTFSFLLGSRDVAGIQVDIQKRFI